MARSNKGKRAYTPSKRTHSTVEENPDDTLVFFLTGEVAGLPHPRSPRMPHVLGEVRARQRKIIAWKDELVEINAKFLGTGFHFLGHGAFRYTSVDKELARSVFYKIQQLNSKLKHPRDLQKTRVVVVAHIGRTKTKYMGREFMFNSVKAFATELESYLPNGKLIYTGPDLKV
jgi:hypothetical protein